MFTIEEIIQAVSARVVCPGRSRKVRSVSIDSRTTRPASVFIAVIGTRCDGHAFIKDAVAKGAACVIVQKGHFFNSRACAGVWVLEVADTTKALGDVARFHRNRFSIPVIAVTGSNGKTTTKEMLATLLGQRYTVLKTAGTQNNHIGLPLTLLKLKPSHQAAVLELGTNHPGEIAYLGGICLPTMCVITAVGPSHLEFFKTVAGVRKEKLSLLKFLRAPGGIAVVNADDVRLRGCKAPFVVTYGCSHPADFSAKAVVRRGKEQCFTMHGQEFVLPVIGEHNVSNCLAAIACARLLGLTSAEAAKALRRVRLPAGRLQVKRIRQVDCIDDSYNANPFSLAQALRSLRQWPGTGRKVFIMGDMLELGRGSLQFHRQAGKQAVSSCDIFISVGKQARHAADAAREHGLPRQQVFCCSSCDQAAAVLRDTLRVAKGDVVLAKASHSMHLGEVFGMLAGK